jgi:2',3'-cyclic-nucleotide 2'-phosphodiesterase (5'-nucleotidase family)
MNNIGYNLMLPGNWEVAYGKEIMMEDMFGYNCPKVCANMFHKTSDETTRPRDRIDKSSIGPLLRD